MKIHYTILLKGSRGRISAKRPQYFILLNDNVVIFGIIVLLSFELTYIIIICLVYNEYS